MSAGSSVRPAFDAARLERILANLETRGIAVVRGEKAAVLLGDLGAGAAYSPMFGKPHLFFRDGPVLRGAVVEELLHHRQSLRRGYAEAADSVASKRITLIDEIEAQQYMIEHAIRKNWSLAEVDFYRGQLHRWQDKYEAFQLEYGK